MDQEQLCSQSLRTLEAGKVSRRLGRKKIGPTQGGGLSEGGGKKIVYGVLRTRRPDVCKF
jgi:hypothetical protein